MSITSGFFNSVSGDRTYNADDMSNYWEGLISSGVIANPATSLQVIAEGSDMTVKVQPGRAIIENRWLKSDAVETFTITAADGLLNRIDALVVRYSVFDRQIILALKNGTPATSPVAPAMTRTEATVEYCLATIYVAAGATKISQSNVTDTRPNRAVCGFVTNLVDNIDITALYTQWQTAFDEQYRAFNELYEQIKTTLQVPTTVKKYEATYSTTASTTTIAIPLEQYTSGDALLVHIGGILLREGTDYTVNGTSITFPTAVDAGRDYTFIVFKCEV